MTRTGFARRLALVAVSCLLLAGCDGNGDPDQGATGPTSAGPTQPPLPLAEQDSASDGGTVEVQDIGFTVLEERESGSSVVAWAATFANTSESDLLTYVDFELTWQDGSGQTEVYPWSESSQQRAYDVLPGQTAVVGGATDVPGFVPDTLDVTLHADQWYPMRDLAAHGLSAGVEVTNASIEVGGDTAVRADYASSYDGTEFFGDDELRLLVVARDAAGSLLGAIGAGDFGIPLPGAGQQSGSVRSSLWPDQADPQASEVTIVRVCCTWVGVS